MSETKCRKRTMQTNPSARRSTSGQTNPMHVIPERNSIHQNDSNEGAAERGVITKSQQPSNEQRRSSVLRPKHRNSSIHSVGRWSTGVNEYPDDGGEVPSTPEELEMIRKNSMKYYEERPSESISGGDKSQHSVTNSPVPPKTAHIELDVNVPPKTAHIELDLKLSTCFSTCFPICSEEENLKNRLDVHINRLIDELKRKIEAEDEYEKRAVTDFEDCTLSFPSEVNVHLLDIKEKVIFHEIKESRGLSSAAKNRLIKFVRTRYKKDVDELFLQFLEYHHDKYKDRVRKNRAQEIKDIYENFKEEFNKIEKEKQQQYETLAKIGWFFVLVANGICYVVFIIVYFAVFHHINLSDAAYRRLSRVSSWIFGLDFFVMSIGIALLSAVPVKKVDDKSDDAGARQSQSQERHGFAIDDYLRDQDQQAMRNIALCFTYVYFGGFLFMQVEAPPFVTAVFTFVELVNIFFLLYYRHKGDLIPLCEYTGLHKLLRMDMSETFAGKLCVLLLMQLIFHLGQDIWLFFDQKVFCSMNWASPCGHEIYIDAKTWQHRLLIAFVAIDRSIGIFRTIKEIRKAGPVDRDDDDGVWRGCRDATALCYHCWYIFIFHESIWIFAVGMHHIYSHEYVSGLAYSTGGAAALIPCIVIAIYGRNKWFAIYTNVVEPLEYDLDRGAAIARLISVPPYLTGGKKTDSTEEDYVFIHRKKVHKERIAKVEEEIKEIKMKLMRLSQNVNEKIMDKPNCLIHDSSDEESKKECLIPDSSDDDSVHAPQDLLILDKTTSENISKELNEAQKNEQDVNKWLIKYYKDLGVSLARSRYEKEEEEEKEKEKRDREHEWLHLSDMLMKGEYPDPRTKHSHKNKQKETKNKEDDVGEHDICIKCIEMCKKFKRLVHEIQTYRKIESERKKKKEEDADFENWMVAVVENDGLDSESDDDQSGDEKLKARMKQLKAMYNGEKRLITTRLSVDDDLNSNWRFEKAEDGSKQIKRKKEEDGVVEAEAHQWYIRNFSIEEDSSRKSSLLPYTRDLENHSEAPLKLPLGMKATEDASGNSVSYTITGKYHQGTAKDALLMKEYAVKKFRYWEMTDVFDKEIFTVSPREIKDDEKKCEECLKKSKKPETKILRRSQRIDYFISHAWDDDAEKKVELLKNFAKEFKSRHKRWPKVWLDKTCIDNTHEDFDNLSIACLPITLGMHFFLLSFTVTVNRMLLLLLLVVVMSTLTSSSLLPLYIHILNSTLQESSCSTW